MRPRSQNEATLTGSIDVSVESAFLQLTGHDYLPYANFDTARIMPYISLGGG